MPTLLLVALRKLLPYLLGAGLILGLAWLVHHRGYEAGYAASEAKWQPRFDAAERELKAANEKARRQEADSIAANESSQRRIDETQRLLDARTADFDTRFRALSMRYTAARSSCQQVPALPGGPTKPDGAAESERRAAEIGHAIAGIGADCESDAARLAEWQRWYTEQRAISNR